MPRSLEGVPELRVLGVWSRSINPAVIYLLHTELLTGLQNASGPA